MGPAQMGMLPSALEPQLYPETNASCSQLRTDLGYSSARGTSPNDFPRMAGNGGSGEGGRLPLLMSAETGDLCLCCFQGKGKRAPLGFHSSSSWDGAEVWGSSGIPVPHSSSARASLFCPTQSPPPRCDLLSYSISKAAGARAGMAQPHRQCQPGIFPAGLG